MKLKDINFGMVDGQNESQEPKFSEMFYEKGGYYNDLKSTGKFIIIGRKGTGKTTLSSYYTVKANLEDFKISKRMVANDFIQKKLLNFSQAEINREENSLFWEYVFLLDIGQALVDFYNSYSIKPKYYFQNLRKILSRHKIQEMQRFLKNEIYKIDTVVTGNNVEVSNSNGYQISKNPNVTGDSSIKYSESENFSKTASRYYEKVPELKKLLFQILKESKQDIVIFYDDMDQFEESIKFEYFLSLMKNMIYSADRLNNDLSKINKSKVCLVLRKDVIDLLQEETNNLNKQTTDHGINISWFDNGSKKAYEHPIMQMVLHKIKNSTGEYKETPLSLIYEFMFEDSREKTIFEFLMERSFGRPRDIVSYLNFLKEAYPEKEKIVIDDLKSVEQKYSEWFYQELMNEIKISDKKEQIKKVMEIVKNFGRPTFKVNQIMSFMPEGDFTEDTLLETLSAMRDYSILGIKNRGNFDFVYRTGLKTKVNSTTKFVVHRGLRKYLSLP